MKIATGILNRGAGSPFPKPGKGGKDDGKAKDVKKGVSLKQTIYLAHNLKIHSCDIHCVVHMQTILVGI